MILTEAQSTWSMNILIRMLFYTAETYRDYFMKIGGKECGVAVRAKVLYGGEGNDIISQYVSFLKVYTEQVKRHGYSRKAVQETIRICRDRDVLAEYLKTRESEVVSIMMMLFDDAYIQRAYHMRVEREAAEKAKIAAEKEVRATVEKEVRASMEKEVREAVEKEAVLASLQATMENAAKMIRAGRVNMDEVPQFFPQLSQEDVEKLRQMADA